MSITVLPTKTIGSLGPVKTDNRAYLRPDSELPATELEAIKDAIIANATEIGLTDGSTAGSLREGLGLTGSLIWEWNGTDVTQFDASPDDFKTDLAAGPTGSPTLVVQDLGGKDGKVLVLSGSTLTGGFIFGVKASELTLPESYLIKIRLLDSDSAIDGGGAVVCYKPGASLQGLFIDRPGGYTSLAVTAVIDDQWNTNKLTMTTAGIMGGAAMVDRLGLQQEIECHRQTGDGTEAFVFRVEEWNPNATGDGHNFDGVYEGQSAGLTTAIGTKWDSVDMDRFGLFIYTGSGGQSGGIKVKSFEVHSLTWA